MTNKERQSKSKTDKALQSTRKLAEAFGDRGLEITLGSVETGGIKSYFSNKLPLLEITTLNAQRLLKVEISSSEQENNKLLHYLFRKTIES